MTSKLMNISKVIFSVILSVLILTGTCFVASAEENDVQSNAVTDNRAEIVIPVNTECKNGVVLEYDFAVNTESDYELELQFYAIARENPTISVEIDGQNPFKGVERLEFFNNWVDASKIHRDELGNEIAAEQKVSEELCKFTAFDLTGEYEMPYSVNLTAGVHHIKVTVYNGNFKLENIVLREPEKVLSYKKWLKGQDVKGKIKKTQVIEGEDAVLKNSRAVIPIADSASANINPASPVTKKLNYIGGANWSDPGTEVTWKFKCKEAGYYKIGFNYRQNVTINGVSYRHLKIDGKTPFEEARRVKFNYDSAWKYMTFGDEEEPYLFYLDEGEHTISLTATPAEMSEVYAGLKNVVALLGDIYIDMTVIIGETVDNNRSYELFEQIPDLEERLEECRDALDEVIDKIEELQDQDNGSLVSNFISAREVLRQMLEHPFSAHKYKSSYYSAYTSISSSLGTITDMPLDIDRIFIMGAAAEEPKTKASFGKGLGFSLKRFFHTFSSDYGLSEDGKEEDITLWVNWGRDQAQSLKALVQENFTAKTGIGVNIKINNATIIQGILAGKGPDVMLYMARTEPVNLAMRGAVVELSQFDDFDEVSKRFNNGALVPYTYKDGVYALPDSQNFWMMFIRKDIIDEFGIEVPKTWDEYLSAATVLQRSNLEVNLPYTQISDSSIVNTGVGGLTLYPTLLLQNGLSIYNDELNATALTQPDQLKIFTDWTEWYTNYKIPSVMDFYNRFRIGSAPMGINFYTLVTQLKVAAPEINGKWIVAELPGVKDENGNINNVSAGSGSACSITKLSKNPEAAWEFLKWWTSAETQVKYSNNLESYIGPLGRVATSNLEAFEEIGWDAELLPTLKAQMSKVEEIPEIPGGYYSARGIDQAFWNVLEQNKKPKDMLIEWGEVIDKEIKRKCEEYDY